MARSSVLPPTPAIATEQAPRSGVDSRPRAACPERRATSMPRRTEAWADVLLLDFETGVTGPQPVGPLPLAYPRLAAALLPARTRVLPVVGIGAVRRLVQVLQRLRPAFVGMTVFTHRRHTCLGVASALRSALPDLELVFGGPHITHADDTGLLPFRKLGRTVTGDGEVALRRLASTLGVRLAGDKCVLGMPAAGHWQSHPEYSVYTNSQTLPRAAILTTEGCPGRCVFCTYGRRGGVRERPIEAVLEEVDWLHGRWGTRELHIHDEGFWALRDRALELLAHLSCLQPGIQIHAKARFDQLDSQLVRAFKEAGGRSVFLGLETGSETLRARMGKGISNSQVRETVRLLRTAGIDPCTYIMFGFPGETRRDVRSTFSLLDEIRPAQVRCTVASVFPGTALERLALSTGRICAGHWCTNAEPIIRYPTGANLRVAEGLLTIVEERYCQTSPWDEYRSRTRTYLSRDGEAYRRLVSRRAQDWLDRDQRLHSPRHSLGDSPSLAPLRSEDASPPLSPSLASSEPAHHRRAFEYQPKRST